jgi:hypothetical protein
LIKPYFFTPIRECLLSAALSINKIEKKQITAPIIIIVQLLEGSNNDIKNRNIGLNNIKVNPITNTIFSGIAFILLTILFPSFYTC